MRATLQPDQLGALLSELPRERKSGSAWRAPLHVFYCSAARFRVDTVEKTGTLARNVFQERVATPDRLRAIAEVEATSAAVVHAAVERKLAVRPIEDLRVDFEDGLGALSPDEEDSCAVSAARAYVDAHRRGGLPSASGIRIRTLRGDVARRSLRTLDLFLTEAHEAIREQRDFVVTLPKVQDSREVVVLADALALLERDLGLLPGSIGVELMVESPQGLFSPEGHLVTAALLAAGQRRVRSVHLGVYDLLGSLSVTAPCQRADHPLAAQVRRLLQLSLAGTGVVVSDGATHRIPVAPHRAAAGVSLTTTQQKENEAAIVGALREHARNIELALVDGVYRGWDLHPAQLVARWATTFAFFRRELSAQQERMRGYVARAQHAGRTGSDFDDAASAQGLLQTFLRGHACGALADTDLTAAGLSPALVAEERAVQAL
ncbi:MAG: DUF6986 family protein, partial [Candidatus Limnocylindrus sp.]